MKPYLIDTIHIQKPGRKRKSIDEYVIYLVVRMYEKMPLCAVKMEKYYEILGIPEENPGRDHKSHNN